MSEDLHVYDVASTAGAPAARRLETLWMSAIGTAYVPYIIVLVNLAAFGSFVRVELPIALFSAREGSRHNSGSLHRSSWG